LKSGGAVASTGGNGSSSQADAQLKRKIEEQAEMMAKI
jgi:hypothetical protein